MSYPFYTSVYIFILIDVQFLQNIDFSFENIGIIKTTPQVFIA